jgi:hypothetical protein
MRALLPTLLRKNKIAALNNDKRAQYLFLSHDFRKWKILNKILENNKSLALFCADLERYKEIDSNDLTETS